METKNSGGGGGGWRERHTHRAVIYANNTCRHRSSADEVNKTPQLISRRLSRACLRDVKHLPLLFSILCQILIAHSLAVSIAFIADDRSEQLMGLTESRRLCRGRMGTMLMPTCCSVHVSFAVHYL